MKKTLIVTGSPRRGTTDALASALQDLIGPGCTLIKIRDCRIGPCFGCDACHRNENHTCVQKDDFALILEKLKEADVLILMSPVYYWSVTAQLKCFIDRFYSFKDWKGKELKVILNGGAATDDVEYELLKRQFEEMTSFLGIPLTGFLAFEAYQDNILTVTDEVKAKLSSIL
ncbi:MAG: flavodoxin family protein [Bullifex sp.]